MDIRLIEDMPYPELIEKLNAGLPHDIRVWAVTEPEMKGNDVANAEYILRLECEDPAFEKSEMQRVLAEAGAYGKEALQKGRKDRRYQAVL